MSFITQYIIIRRIPYFIIKNNQFYIKELSSNKYQVNEVNKKMKSYSYIYFHLCSKRVFKINRIIIVNRVPIKK